MMKPKFAFLPKPEHLMGALISVHAESGVLSDSQMREDRIRLSGSADPKVQRAVKQIVDELEDDGQFLSERDRDGIFYVVRILYEAQQIATSTADNEVELPSLYQQVRAFMDVVGEWEASQ
jgi:hypothetical protein